MIIPGTGIYDLSIVASLYCNLTCPHCQYSAGPDKTEWLDETVLDLFLKTLDWSEINSVGFYGGEISTNLEIWKGYIQAVDLSQLEYWNEDKRRYNRFKKPMWCVTNGSWSEKEYSFYQMIDFVRRHDLTVYISTTPWHRAHQDYRRLKLLTNTSDRFKFKKDDTKSRLLPMGRNYSEDWYCTRRCLREEATDRLAIMPNADIIYQKCDGIYPTVINVSSQVVTWTYVKYSLYHQTRCPMMTKDIGEPSWVVKAAACPETLGKEKLRFRLVSSHHATSTSIAR